MTETLKMDDKEQLLREKIKAKQQQKRRESHSSGSSSPPPATTSQGDPEPGRKTGEGNPLKREERARSSSQDRRGDRRRRGSARNDRGRDMPRRPSNGRGGRGGPGYHNDYDRRGGGRQPPYDYRGRGGPPPYDPYYPPRDDWRGPPPPPHRGGGRYRRDEDDFGRRRRSLSPSRSRSVSRSRSYSSDSSRSRSRSRSESRGRRGRRSPSISSRSSYSDSDASSESSVASRGEEEQQQTEQNQFSKDQRTVFVTQLVQRTKERDIKRYLQKNELKVNEVILLRDKRTGRHKGCAYVELRRMDDVAKAVALSNQAPDFQRFPILIKSSEAEKNYTHTATNTSLTAAQMGTTVASGPIVGDNGKSIEAQKVYVGSLDPSITQEHLFVLFSQFGQLEKVAMQMDSSTGMSKGFAFLSFRDPKEANLAIQTMSNQVLAGRPMKTGWAVNQIASYPGAEVVTSKEFPQDASARATNAFKVLSQMNMGVPMAQIRQGGPEAAAVTPAAVSAAPLTTVAAGGAISRVPTVADARASLAGSGASVAVPAEVIAPSPAAAVAAPQVVAAAATDPSKIGNADHPSQHILVHNMFDKDTETEEGWEAEIKEEFIEECSKFGQITAVTVMSKEVGGKIFASFDTIQGAQNCASSLAGRWFDKRQLRAEFVAEDVVPHKV